MDKATRRALKHLSYVPRFRDHTIHYRTNVLFGKTKVSPCTIQGRGPAVTLAASGCLPAAGARHAVRPQRRRPQPRGHSGGGNPARCFGSDDVQR